MTPDVAADGYTKHRPDAPEGFFAAEAAGLRWLAVPDGVPVAGVRSVTRTSLTIDRVPPGSPSVASAEEFGRRLAATHDAGASFFGAGPDGGPGLGWIGDAPLPLRSAPPASWGAWYAEDRLLFHARRAHLGDPALSRVIERLAAGDFDDAASAARIHGDLWSGNVLWSPTGAVLIDPAAHGGHRVTDLAMLALFGTPQLARIHAAYQEASDSLPDGWRDLIGLHQLHPLLVHADLFGGGYAAQAVAVARRYR
ncbi:MAG: fructosamine kinase family protein [Micropruina sp.]|uniref:fructosamine kinase family protein n=1 Tax=Micropruina sp. TaxID=2737536 RepID=UPI0039E513B5